MSNTSKNLKKLKKHNSELSQDRDQIMVKLKSLEID
jgi:hypothetical protein